MKKVLLLCQQGFPIELSPARYQLIHELKRLNYEIYVFFPGKICNKSIKDKINHYTNTANLSVKAMRKKIVNIAPQYVIAFTFEDTNILYSLPWKMKRTTFIYYNLEIYTPSMEEYIQTKGRYSGIRCRVAYIKNKIKEVIYVHNCKILVIQDNLRRKISSKYYIHHSNTILIPNSYISNYDNVLDAQRKGIICSGGMNKLVMQTLLERVDTLLEVPITFSGWCDGWVVKQFKKIHKLNPNIEFINQKLSPDEHTEFINRYAVGLVWYSPTNDENVYNIGMSSGKFFKHLSIGQPVIALDCPGLSEVVEKYKLGKVIHNVSEIGEAYRQIMENYSFYQRNIQNVYRKKFDYLKVVKPFLDQLEK